MPETLLKIRPAQEDPDEKLHRGPLYMEPAVSALHSLKGSDREISMEMGMGRDSKISFYVRGTERGTRLAESHSIPMLISRYFLKIRSRPMKMKRFIMLIWLL